MLQKPVLSSNLVSASGFHVEVRVQSFEFGLFDFRFPVWGMEFGV